VRVEHPCYSATANGTGSIHQSIEPSRVSRPEAETPEVVPYARFDSPDLERRSLILPTPIESRAKTIGYTLLAAILVVAYFYVLLCFWAPANAGTDQNGYQVGGKLFAQTFSTGFKPQSPFEFIGWMWVRTSDGWYYPKYPLGLPVLDAIALWIGGKAHGVHWAYLVSPICSALALFGMYRLTRLVAGSFASLLAVLLLACNGVMLVLANNSNSHAPAICFVTWGMYFLVRWWQKGGWWRGSLAGFLLGYAVTIRYTEGLLALPIGFAMLSTLRYARPWRAEQRRLLLATVLSVFAILVAYFLTYVPIAHPLLSQKMAIASAIGACAIGLVFVVLGRPRGGEARAGLYSITVSVMLILAAVALPMRFMQIQIDPKAIIRPPGWFIILSGVYLLLVVGVMSIRWTSIRLTTLAPFVGWIIPVGLLVAFNWFAMHSITGYDSTNESTGFTWQQFAENWDFMLQQLDNGMFLLFPIALLGLALMYRWNWKFALLMTLWFVPGTLLYTSYYWNGSFKSIAFLRFFLTLFPPLIVAACWLFDQYITGPVIGSQGSPEQSAVRHLFHAPLTGIIATGLLVALVTGISLNANLGGLERDSVLDTNLADAGQRILARVPAGSTIFGDQRMLLNYIQFAEDYKLFAPEAFSQRFGGRMMREGDPNQPTPLQNARRAYMRTVYEKMDEASLIAEQSRIIREALQSGRRVFYIMPQTMMAGPFLGRIPKEFSAVTIVKWKEPAEMGPRAKRAFDAIGMFALMLGRGSNAISWQIIEIKQAENQPAASKPTTRPAASTTKPSTTRRSFFGRLRT
jgi:4-amino-4-deoxy-L-arabinose transferase-like glycosyltransferase